MDQIRLGDWTIEPELNRITGGGSQKELAPKEMETLVYLFENNDRVVGKEELLREVWAGVVVNDNTIVRVIANLRKALEDDWQEPRFIETISKSGYRLIIPDAVSEHGSVREKKPSGLRKKYFLSGAAAVIIIGAIWSFTRSNPVVETTLPEPLTTLPGREIEGELSPDGKMLAFVWEGENKDNWDIYLKLVGTDDIKRLTSYSHYDMHPTWTADGTQLVFVRYQDDGDCGIYKMTAFGGDVIKLTDCEGRDITGAEISPDGETLVFTERQDPGAPVSIVLFSLKTSEKKFITNPPRGSWGDLEPAFSPDGRRIAWRRILGEGIQDLYWMETAGGEPRKLTSVKRFIRGLDWSPDGAQVIFTSTSSGQWRLWSVPLTGRSPKPIPVNHTNVRQPQLVKNSMIYVQSVQESNIKAIALEDKAAREIVISSQPDEHPAISGNGRFLAYTSSKSGSHELWVDDLINRSSLRLTSFGDTYVSNPVWSPRDKFILFEVRVSGYIHLFKVDRKGGNLVQLTSGEYDNFAPSWTGKHIYFTSNRSGDWEIWKNRFDEERSSEFDMSAIPVTRDGGFSAKASSDGKKLLLTKYGVNGLWEMDMTSGNERLLIEQLDWFDWNNWCLRNKAIYYIDRESEIIMRHQSDADKADWVYKTQSPLPSFFRSFDVSADGKTLYVTQAENKGSDIMMVKGEY